jgi:hypothetical protein
MTMSELVYSFTKSLLCMHIAQWRMSDLILSHNYLQRTKNTEKRVWEPTLPSQIASHEPSEEPAVPGMFKMSIGKIKKPKKSESTNQDLKVGLSIQEAAAIVNAATRDVSPFCPEPPKADLGQLKSGSGSIKTRGIDEDWIAETITITAALIKAERPKRAKMFASMIKSSSAGGGGPPLPQLLIKVESSKVEVNDEIDCGDNSKREKGHCEKSYRKQDNSLEERKK